MALRVLKFVFAALISQGIVQFVLFFASGNLHTTAPLIGYPIFANFNINRLFEWYYLQALFFPALTLLIFLRTDRSFFKPDAGANTLSVRFLPPLSLPDLPIVRNFIKMADAAKAISKLIFTGGMLSVATLPWSFFGGNFLAQVSVFCIGYNLLVLFLSWLKKLSVATVNLWFLPFGWFALYGASSVTGVWVEGKFNAYPWFPVALALGLTFLTMFVLVRARRKCLTDDAVKALETEAVFLVLVPFCVFISQSKLLPLTRFEVFHFGEFLVPGLLLREGYFPWRDLFFSHGLLQDPFQSLLGHSLFEESFWGVSAGMTLIYMPLYWVANYYLAYTLFRRKRLFLVGLFFILPFVLPGLFARTHFRFLLWPMILVVFCQMMTLSSQWWVVLFSVLLFVQAIVTPESAYAVIASGIALILADGLSKNFRRTFYFAATSFVCLLVWFCFLYVNEAHWAFIEYYQTFVPHHRLTGGLPFQTWAAIDPVFVYVPVVLNVLCFWYFGLTFSRKRMMSPIEWTMFLSYLFMVFYYQKFLSRADSHIYSVVAMSYPLLFWAFDSLFTFLDRLLRLPKLVSTLSLGLICLLIRFPWPNQIQTLRQQFQVQATGPVKLSRLGYFDLTPKAEKFVAELKSYLENTLNPEDKIFDFSNSPGLYFYLLDRRPSTRFFHVSMAIRLPTQRLLISELEREKPKLIVFHGKSDLGSWDGISNMVRHFEVSRYLLTHYEPARKIGDSLVFLRRSQNSGQIETARKRGGPSLYFETESCRWGHTPLFLRSWEALREGKRETVIFSQRKEYDQFIVEFPLPKDRAKYSAVEIEFDKLQKDNFSLFSKERSQTNEKNLITFSSVPGSQVKYFIPVGSCSQWYGYDNQTIQLTHRSAQKIAAIRLIQGS